MDKYDLPAGIKTMRTVAKLLTQWADDLEKNGSFVSGTDGPEREQSASVQPDAVQSTAAQSDLDRSNVVQSDLKSFSLADVKAFLSAKCAAGYSTQVRALIASFGAASLSGISPTLYPKLMEAASSIGVGDGEEGAHAG